MEQHYQKEVNIGKMLKTLAKRWVAIVLAFVIALVAGVAVTFLATFTNKVYGVDLDFHVYQISNVDKEGNAIIGTPTEYDESTMNLVLQNVASQSFLEAIYCDDGIPVENESMSDELKTAIAKAKELDKQLKEERKTLTAANSEYIIAKKNANLAKSTLEVEQAKYSAAYNAYNGALQANATAASGGSGQGPLIEQDDLNQLKVELSTATKSYNNAQDAYVAAQENAGIKEQTHFDCQQQIISLNRELNFAKTDAMNLLRKQDEYKEFMKGVKKSITVSYAKNDKNEEIKSTVRVSIAVDKKIEDNEAFAVSLAEKVREQLPNFVVEKVDYATTYCELTNVLDEVEQVNKEETIKNVITIGLLAGFVTLLVACVVVAVKNKQEFVVLVPYDTEE
ncbi:MAG: hypothetical protein IJD54_00560 [Clostridia bacterium]|nr:hypothetical protein [Clostridia bacterium]